MILTLLAAGLLSLPPLPGAPAPSPQLPFTEVLGQIGGTITVRGKDFQATAHRLSISPDGKYLELQGTNEEPATLSRTNGPWPRAVVSGKRIAFSLSEGTMRVEGAGSITEPK